MSGDLFQLIFFPPSEVLIGNVIAGNVLRAAESALLLEQGRLQKFQQIEESNQALRLTQNKVLLDLLRLGFEILRNEFS